MSKQGQIEKRYGANLPHWTKEGATYAVTFRLADSLPELAIQKLRRQIEQVDRKFAQGSEALSLEELIRRSKLKSDLYQELLDEGHVACFMDREDVAEVVAGALLFFKDKRYRPFAWCVMPNHVHVVVQPIEGHSLPEILHSWKSSTATRANKILGRSGAFWQRESYDHLIRDRADFARHVQYTRENPDKAGLKDWAWVG